MVKCKTPKYIVKQANNGWMITYEKELELLDILKLISKKGNFKILITLKSGAKKWSQLEKLLDKKTLYNSLKELCEAGLIEPVVIKDSVTGSKAYALTDFGKLVLEKLEELAKSHDKVVKT